MDADETATAEGIFIGEVWLASGQSNMEWSLAQSGESETEIHGARFPEIHFFRQPLQPALTPEYETTARWSLCNPETARDFSAVAYQFARRLLPELSGVHVGLIQAAWGGSMAVAWMPRAALSVEPDFLPALQRSEAVTRFGAPSNPPVVADTGNTAEARGWARADYDDRLWPTMPLPNLWQDRGLNFHGAVWFRREIKIPERWEGREITLELGAVDDHDCTYFNGQFLGGIGAENPDAWRTPRTYRVPAEMVREGIARVAVRVFDQFGKGGVVGPADSMRMRPVDDPEDQIPLAGLWRYAVEREVPTPPPSPEEAGLGLPTETASALWNGMLASVAGYQIRGFIWYQGESDEPRANLYRKILPALIRGWRTAWGDKTLPFYLVQLPPFRVPGGTVPHFRPELREAQALAADALENVEYVVTLDCGNPRNNHPADKRTVGRRLAHIALSRDYGCAFRWRGPRYSSITLRPTGVRVHFAHTADGLRSRDGAPLRGFEVASRDGPFVPALAICETDDVFVRAPDGFAEPRYVRYSWRDDPAGNLENSEGLPAAPFRTDQRISSSE